MSTDVYSEELESTIAESKMLFIVSAGNGKDGGSRGINIDKMPVYPAAFNLSNILTVTNLDYNGNLYKNSNYGQESVDIAAPGTCIYSTSLNGEYSYCSGTSMATPMVTGVAALIYSMVDGITAFEAKNMIIGTVTKRNELSEIIGSGGMLNGGAAIENAITRMFKSN
jgi:subtilisin family serine protease